MKTKSIIPDPLKFFRVGINSMQQAAILVHVGRCGLQGCRIDAAGDALRMSTSTVNSALGKLQDAGLVVRFGRTNRRGRAFYWTVSVRGWELLTSGADVDLFPCALEAMKGGDT